MCPRAKSGQGCDKTPEWEACSLELGQGEGKERGGEMGILPGRRR